MSSAKQNGEMVSLKEVINYLRNYIYRLSENKYFNKKIQITAENIFKNELKKYLNEKSID
jgi:hypothetical protein